MTVQFSPNRGPATGPPRRAGAPPIRRSRTASGSVLVVTLLATVIAGCTNLEPAASPSTQPPRANVVVTVGAREVVLDSGVEGYPDIRYFTYSWQGHSYGVLSGAGRHRRYADPLAVPLTGGEPMSGLEPGPATFDRSSVALDDVHPVGDGTTLVGIYQAEHPRQDPSDTAEPNRSLALARSGDGGLTWTKPSYPDNQIITAPPGGEATNASLAEVGEDLYLLFTQNRQPTMARAPKSDGGRPGSWRKWYCPTTEERQQAGIPDPRPGEKPYCDFLEPGLGGRATPLAGLKSNPFLSRNNLLEAYLAVDDTIREGRLALRTSVNLESWLAVANEPVLPDPEAEWGYVAPSLVADDATPNTTGKTFWLYYLEWNMPRSAKRLLVRQHVTLSPVGS